MPHFKQLCCFAYAGFQASDRGVVLLDAEWRYLAGEQLESQLPDGNLKNAVYSWLETYEPSKQFIVVCPRFTWAELHTGTGLNTPASLHAQTILEVERKHGVPQYPSSIFRKPKRSA